MKKVVAYMIVGFVLSTIGLLGYYIYDDLLESEQVRERIAELPDLSVSPVIIPPSDSFSPRP